MFLLIATGCVGSAAFSSMAARPTSDVVHPLFDLSSPKRSPFPSDRLTVTDRDQNTGRRVNLPMPADCIAKASECDDIAALNQLDGFNIRARLSIPFDGDIDPTSVTSDSVFLVSIGDALDWSDAIDASCHRGVDRDDEDVNDRFRARHSSFGGKAGINQVAWNPGTRTLHAMSDELLDEHSHYAIVVTRGVRDASGNAVEPHRLFERFRRFLSEEDTELCRYAGRLLLAQFAARRTGVDNRDIAALSFFSTQSVSYLVEAISRQISAGNPAPADFNVVPGGSRAVFPLNSIAGMTFNGQNTVGPVLTPTSVNLALTRAIPGAVGHLAYGRFVSPDYLVHPTQHIPHTPTRTAAPAPTGLTTIPFELAVPSGAKPAGGWPVMIMAHGRGAPQHFLLHARAAFAASRGMATISFSFVGHGRGPASTLTLRTIDGSTVTIPSPGRGYDQDGNGVIELTDGDLADHPYRLEFNSSATVQDIADVMQLVRVIQVGVDMDGDGQHDLDPERIYYNGISFGGSIGIPVAAFTPAIRAAAFIVPGGPRIENWRNQPGTAGLLRSLVGRTLDARTPSLLNSDVGLTTIGGLPVAAPFFNENIPLRDQPVLVDTVPGAAALQQFFDRSVWLSNVSGPNGFAPLLRRRPPPGIPPRPFLIQYARGDQNQANFLTAELLRAGGLESQTVLYRHDLFFADNPAVVKNPHTISNLIATPVASTIARAAQDQVVRFLESDGAVIVQPEPVRYWEVAVLMPLPEDFGFIR